MTAKTVTAKTVTAKTVTAELPIPDAIPTSETTLDLPPVETLELAGVTWRYSVSGEGGRPLLALPGALGGAEVGLRLLPFLDGYRILSVAYPAIEDIDTLMRGIEGVLAAEGLERLDVIGGSFGGLVAQCFVRHAPQRVRRLLLQGTGVPTPSRAASNAKFLRLAHFLPMGVFRALLRLVMRRMLRQMPGQERRFWLTYYFRELAAFTKRDLICRYHLAIDFDRNHRFTPEDLAGREIPVLILEGSEDRISKGEHRGELAALYPNARVHTFEGVGHGMSLLRPEEWGKVIAEFLADTQNGDSPADSK